MAGLFYLFGFIFLFNEIMDVMNPLKRHKKTKALLDKSKRLKELEKTKNDNWVDKADYDAIAKEILTKVMVPLFTYLWLFIGLLSSQWIFFLGMIIMTMIHGTLGKISKNQYYKAVLIFIFSFINMETVAYVILNHFHHIDIINF